MRIRQRIVKLVVSVEITREDWGVKVVHPTLGLVASADTEDEALDKMDKMVVRQLDFDLAHAKAKPAKMGR